MIIVGKPVPYRHSRILAKFLACFLRKTAEKDAVVDAPENAGGILDRFLFAEMNIGTCQILAVATFIAHGNQRRITRARGTFLEDKRNILAMEQISADTCRPARLELRGQIDEVEHLLVGERS